MGVVVGGFLKRSTGVLPEGMYAGAKRGRLVVVKFTREGSYFVAMPKRKVMGKDGFKSMIGVG